MPDVNAPLFRSDNHWRINSSGMACCPELSPLTTVADGISVSPVTLSLERAFLMYTNELFDHFAVSSWINQRPCYEGAASAPIARSRQQEPLDEAGVDVIAVRYEGLIHDYGLLNYLSRVPAVRAALHQAAEMLKKHLE